MPKMHYTSPQDIYAPITVHTVYDRPRHVDPTHPVHFNANGLHTIKGKGVKANQGWNAAIWAIWNELIKKGKATNSFFRAVDAKMESGAE